MGGLGSRGMGGLGDVASMATLLAAHWLSSRAAISGELWVDRYVCVCSKPFVCICKRAPCLLHVSCSHTHMRSWR